MLLQMAEFHSFLWLSDIPYTYICIYTHIRVCVCVCVCVRRIFFIHSPFDGCLGCFRVLPIVDSAAVGIGVHVSF